MNREKEFEDCLRIAAYHMAKAQEYLDKAKTIKGA